MKHSISNLFSELKGLHSRTQCPSKVTVCSVRGVSRQTGQLRSVIVQITPFESTQKGKTLIKKARIYFHAIQRQFKLFNQDIPAVHQQNLTGEAWRGHQPTRIPCWGPATKTQHMLFHSTWPQKRHGS